MISIGFRVPFRTTDVKDVKWSTLKGLITYKIEIIIRVVKMFKGWEIIKNWK